ncbi:MAG: GNAT family N-acetyltransferase [Cyclobacteriaceae bacterium]
MNNRYEIFERGNIDRLFSAFVDAFSGNQVHFNPPFAQFEKRIFHKLHIEDHISGLILDPADRVLGFALHTAGVFEGVRTAYNGGMGVVLDQRRTGLANFLLESTLPLLQKGNINKVLLEVITSNVAAIRLYESFGFSFRRELKCFKLYDSLKHQDEKIEIIQSDSLKEAYRSFWSFPTTFLDSTDHLKYNLENEHILEAHLDGILAGYIIFQPDLGRVSQLAVADGYRNKGIGKQLLQKAQILSDSKEITIMNVPEEQESTIVALEKMGFKNEVDQYEMELII